tara:strand:+ start:3666 stop:4043 length:378 start_codon:yes stop_codon:yes gene_type:complete
MAFKLKTKGDLFGYNEKLSEWGKPVFEKNLEDGVMAEANNDRTTFIDKSLTEKEQLDAVEHENKHHDQMQQNRLQYDDNTVTWKKDTRSPSRVYKRDKGALIAMDSGKSDHEGGDFEWEDEARDV